MAIRPPGDDVYWHFLELPSFTSAWDRDLRLSDTALAELQQKLMQRPDCGPVIRGTGGLRKMRYSPGNWTIGKRGALRICYALYPEYATIVLAAVYGKSVREDLGATERREISQILQLLGNELRRKQQSKRGSR